MTLQRTGTVLVVGLAALLLSLVAIGTGRGLAAVLAAAAVLFGLGLAAQARRYESTLEMLSDAGEWALALAPGLLLVFFSFNGGGYFPAPDAFVALVLALTLGLRMWFGSEPLAGFGGLAALAAGLLALFGLWTALSASWSDAPGRALVETDRVLLYLLALLLFASFPRSTDRIRLMVRGLAGAAVLVCLVGLITRVMPDVWPIGPDLQQGRLGYPLTYWNAFGLLAALGLILCVHLASSERESPLTRVLGAAATPVLGVALFFTFSRGAIAVAIIGLVAYALLSRPRGLLGGLLAVVPSTAIAVISAYHADLLSSDNPTTAAAASQGHDVALVVALCAAGAAAVRAVALWLDGALSRVRLRARWRRTVPAIAWALGTVLVLVVFVGARGPHRLSQNYDKFVHGNAVVQTGDLRSRLGDPGNNRRIDQWKVAWKGYKEDRFRGLGAGTYENLWNERRPVRFAIQDAHSLYVEVLAELGFAGMALLGGALALILFGFVRGMWRSRDRYVYAALVAALLAWLLRAGLDWDWEMPAITLWLFCTGATALAVSVRAQRRVLRIRRAGRLALSLACFALALVPAAVAVSQHRIEGAQAALERGDCAKASSEAHGALDVVSFLPEPQQVLAYCAAQQGRMPEAVSLAREAVRHDPDNWRYHYDVALLTAASGGDPQPAAREAAALNPREPAAAVLPTVLGRPNARALALDLVTRRR